MTYTVWVGDGLTTELAGGKGRSLDTLARLGLRVPAAFVVTTEAYRAAVDAQELDRRVARLHPDADMTEFEAAAESIRDWLFAETFGHQADAEIRSNYQKLSGKVAVRSSSAAEDGAQHSFAGEHDSYLNVMGEDNVSEAVRRCWASLFTARAISYRAREDVPSDAMAVVVQRMIDPRAAGVFMTLNPVNGDRSKVVIESVLGLGEPLVSGLVTPDRFVVDKVSGEIVTRAPAADQPSLTDAEILELLEIARKVERHAGTPQDCEFAIDDSGIHLVQARPETVWSAKPTQRVTDGTTGAMAHVLRVISGTKPKN
ncbi:PEP/pyruvate-binding domain-containing protein [Kibdelosporangium philippinense]|uniref:Phosphoenolpyruvate synthase n=1 Tax=Kibdelosporangium philippinense TaxID=211113 RepID=A0ABS8ZA24_9PSEU|nr:PEP/pyruvate-binding domain-containing protein [Kibdelosporangium philippinense]MCE7004382.1 PEP/pyruvate-binding domain-containing protein [Kibdelosporangium philippinense]